MGTPAAVDLLLPGSGRWRVHNSPADRVPSHGTVAFASAYAIDLTPVDEHGRSASVTIAALVRTEPAERFIGFGRPVLAPIAGQVVRSEDGLPDHRAHRGLASFSYALTQGRRAAGGWRAVAGNHLMIAAGPDGPFVALCHLRRGSIRVPLGATVARGQEIAACGNSGNSTEPHVHLQVMTAADPARADAIPLTLDRRLPRTGCVIGQL